MGLVTLKHFKSVGVCLAEIPLHDDPFSEHLETPVVFVAAQPVHPCRDMNPAALARPSDVAGTQLAACPSGLQWE